MKTKIGVWIDHRQAIIVTVANGKEELSRVLSKVEKQPRRSGDAPMKGSYEVQQKLADDSQQRSFTGHLDVYYDEVVTRIREAEAILIFGPGEAKGELQKRLEKNKLGARIIAVEAVDKMTDRQIIAKVRDYFPK